MFEYAKPESKQKEKSKNTVQRKEREAPRQNLTGIPDATKSRFENLSGFSDDDVRVHYNSGRPAQLQALAYTQGNQVYIAPGQDRYLGHELGHVAQQKQNRVRPTLQLKGILINDSAALEREADALSEKAARHTPEAYRSAMHGNSRNAASSGQYATVQRYPVYELSNGFISSTPGRAGLTRRNTARVQERLIQGINYRFFGKAVLLKWIDLLPLNKPFIIVMKICNRQNSKI